MSFNRLNYDTQAYKQSIEQSANVGNYNLETPCFCNRTDGGYG